MLKKCLSHFLCDFRSKQKCLYKDNKIEFTFENQFFINIAIDN